MGVAMKQFRPIASAIFTHHMQLLHQNIVIFDQKTPAFFAEQTLGKRTRVPSSNKGFTFRGEYAKTSSYQGNEFSPNLEFNLGHFPTRFNKHDPLLSDSFDEMIKICENALVSLGRFDYRTRSVRLVCATINRIIEMANEYWTNTGETIWTPTPRSTSNPKKPKAPKEGMNCFSPKDFHIRRIHILLLIEDLRNAYTVLNSCFIR
jgi:hypothetical protein